MFVDYYSILEINENATQEEIKSAFRKQALKWHPDRNLGVDTTLRMQQINEAYLILKDTVARERFNIEYIRFKQYQQQKARVQQEQHQHKAEERQERTKQAEKMQYEYSDYTINDDVLKKWMENAKRQAVNLAKQTIEDLRGITIDSAKAIGTEVLAGTGRYIIFSVIMILLIALVKSCRG